jgi:hypothetical protein
MESLDRIAIELDVLADALEVSLAVGEAQRARELADRCIRLARARGERFLVGSSL